MHVGIDNVKNNKNMKSKMKIRVRLSSETDYTCVGLGSFHCTKHITVHLIICITMASECNVLSSTICTMSNQFIVMANCAQQYKL